MTYNYGYGVLENQLIDLFLSGAPDFDKAEEIIAQGANIEQENSDSYDNVLSEILASYWTSRYDYSECPHNDSTDEGCYKGDFESCDGCPFYKEVNPNLYDSMLSVIYFFINHGFDMTKHNGRLGAQCLEALALSIYDRKMIEIYKVLFENGARNVSYNLNIKEPNLPFDSITLKCSFLYTCKDDLHSYNLYGAVIEMFLAIDKQKEYRFIDSYEAAINKTLLKVCTKATNIPPFYSLDLPDYHKDFCFKDTLYFEFDDGYLIIESNGDIWFDKVSDENLVDISSYFEEYIGSKISNITPYIKKLQKEDKSYKQDVNEFTFDSGTTLLFTDNYGEVPKEYTVSYCIKE